MFNIQNRDEIIQNIYSGRDLVYKFSTNTLLRIDDSIKHIKKHKKTYKKIILYLALCMSPFLAEVGHDLIKVFMYSLSSIPKENLLIVLMEFFSQIAKFLVVTLVIKDIVVNTFNAAVMNIRR